MRRANGAGPDPTGIAGVEIPVVEAKIAIGDREMTVFDRHSVVADRPDKAVTYCRSRH